MIYGYARVSTIKQDRHGNSLQEQTELLQAAGCTQIFHDSYTGTKMDRPEFTKLMSILKPGDTLVVTKLDRFARNAADGATAIRKLMDDGVRVNILNMGIADNTPMGRLMVHILLAFAEYERDLIVERTQDGRAIARAKGKRVDGRPAATLQTIAGFTDAYRRFKAGEVTIPEACKELGICRSTWYKLAKAYTAA